MPLPSTYTPIATNTLTAAAATVTFSNIPSTYTDLVLAYNGKWVSVTGQISLQFNGDTATNYSDTTLQGDGTSVTSGRDISVSQSRLGYTASANTENTTVLNIQNYSNTTTYKTILSKHNTPGGANVQLSVGLWRSTAAINQIAVSCYNANTFASGSTFTLYGIKAA